MDQVTIGNDWPIEEFKGEFGFLSNFSPSPIYYKDIRYPTVEHGFQAAKTLDIGLRKYIAQLDSPGEAKRCGRRLEIRPDWELIKVLIMYDLLRRKFSPGTANSLLLINTGDRLLIEGNNWNDTIWGVCNGQGFNLLGQLLMRIRSEIDGFHHGWYNDG